MIKKINLRELTEEQWQNIHLITKGNLQLEYTLDKQPEGEVLRLEIPKQSFWVSSNSVLSEYLQEIFPMPRFSLKMDQITFDMCLYDRSKMLHCFKRIELEDCLTPCVYRIKSLICDALFGSDIIEFDLSLKSPERIEVYYATLFEGQEILTKEKFKRLSTTEILEKLYNRKG